ncbi:MAG: DHH family phosphoesterase [Planctomycetota bacterium]|nr:DHH family phosphoesterase [Planctomycetota bacterium]
MPDIRQEIANLLRTAKKVLITTHIRMDGDALGSSLGLLRTLRESGTAADAVNASPVPSQYVFMPRAGELFESVPDPASYDIFVALDCANEERLGFDMSQLSESCVTVNIDHHPTNSRFARYNFIDGKAPCAGEMLLDIIQRAELECPAYGAQMLYIALLTDTGRFSFPNTTQRAFDAAIRLVRKGADPAEAANSVYFTRSPKMLRFLGHAYSSLKFLFDEKFAYISLKEKDLHTFGLDKYDTQEIVDIPRLSAASKVAAFLLELDEGITRISLRSKDSLDCSLIAAHFGGGGHKGAAGATYDGPMHEAEKIVCEQVVKLLDIHDAEGECS